MFDAFILEKLWEVGGESLYAVAALSIRQVRDLGQTVSEMVVRLAGNVHVSQGEVHP